MDMYVAKALMAGAMFFFAVMFAVSSLVLNGVGKLTERISEMCTNTVRCLVSGMLLGVVFCHIYPETRQTMEMALTQVEFPLANFFIGVGMIVAYVWYHTWDILESQPRDDAADNNMGAKSYQMPSEQQDQTEEDAANPEGGIDEMDDNDTQMESRASAFDEGSEEEEEEESTEDNVTQSNKYVLPAKRLRNRSYSAKMSRKHEDTLYSRTKSSQSKSKRSSTRKSETSFQPSTEVAGLLEPSTTIRSISAATDPYGRGTLRNPSNLTSKETNHPSNLGTEVHEQEQFPSFVTGQQEAKIDSRSGEDTLVTITDVTVDKNLVQMPNQIKEPQRLDLRDNPSEFTDVLHSGYKSQQQVKRLPIAKQNFSQHNAFVALPESDIMNNAFGDLPESNIMNEVLPGSKDFKHVSSDEEVSVENSPDVVLDFNTEMWLNRPALLNVSNNSNFDLDGKGKEAGIDMQIKELERKEHRGERYKRFACHDDSDGNSTDTVNTTELYESLIEGDGLAKAAELNKNNNAVRFEENINGSSSKSKDKKTKSRSKDNQSFNAHMKNVNQNSSETYPDRTSRSLMISSKNESGLRTETTPMDSSKMGSKSPSTKDKSGTKSASPGATGTADSPTTATSGDIGENKSVGELFTMVRDPMMFIFIVGLSVGLSNFPLTISSVFLALWTYQAVVILQSSNGVYDAVGGGKSIFGYLSIMFLLGLMAPIGCLVGMLVCYTASVWMAAAGLGYAGGMMLFASGTMFRASSLRPNEKGGSFKFLIQAAGFLSVAMIAWFNFGMFAAPSLGPSGPSGSTASKATFNERL